MIFVPNTAIVDKKDKRRNSLIKMNTIDTPRADDATHEQISDIEAIDQTQVQQMKAKKSKSVEDQTIAINEDKVIEELPQTNNDDAKVVQKSPKAHYQQSVSEETCCKRHKYTLPLFIFGSVCCIGIIVLIVIVIVLNAQTTTQNQVSYKQGNFLASSNSEFETIKIKQLFDPPNWQGRYKPFSSKEEYKNQCSARPVYEEEFIFITDDEFQQILYRMTDRGINKMDAQCKISRDKVIQEWQIQEQILSIDREFLREQIKRIQSKEQELGISLVRGKATNEHFINWIKSDLNQSSFKFDCNETPWTSWCKESFPSLIIWLQEECPVVEVSLYELEFKLRSIYEPYYALFYDKIKFW